MPQKPLDVVRLEAAMSELGKLKPFSKAASRRSAHSAFAPRAYESALDAASARFKELGANEGQANYFALAFKG